MIRIPETGFSPNHIGSRNRFMPEGIVLHHIGYPVDKAIRVLSDRKTKAAYHFLVAPNSDIWQLVPMNRAAWHAGKSKWFRPSHRGISGHLNFWTYGIGIVGDLNRYRPTDGQYARTARLCCNLMAQRPAITPQMILGHNQCAPRRKVDPGKLWKWWRFYEELCYCRAQRKTFEL